MRRLIIPAMLVLIALLAAPSTPAAPAPGKDACKDGGYQSLRYSNQGHCVAAANAAARRGAAFPTTQCSNLIDDDNDGRGDFPADQGCSSASDTTEAPDPPQCANRLDDDGDGSSNFPADQGCSSATDTTEAPDPPQCANRLDDDGDGKTNLADPGCASATDNSESPDPTPSFGADLALSIADSPDPVATGSPVTFTVTARNNGPLVSGRAQVVVTFPTGSTSSVQSTPTEVTCNKSGTTLYTCFGPSLAVGASRDIVFSAVLPAGVNTTNGEVHDEDFVVPDPDSTNNEDQETTTVGSVVS